MNRIWYPVLLVLLALAASCGPGEEIAPPSKTNILDRDVLGLTDWEWVIASPTTLPEVSGRIVGPNDEPAAGATAVLLLMPQFPVAPPRRIRSVPTNPEGRFTLSEVPDNAWVMVEAPGLVGYMVPAGQLLEMNARDEPFELRIGGGILGSVHLASGEPIVGAHLVARAHTPYWWMDLRTDEKGRFQVPLAPPGVVGIFLLPGELAAQPVETRVQAGATARVGVEARLVLPVKGRVVDEETGDSIQGAIVSYLQDREKMTVTDGEGRFDIRGEIQPMFVVRAHGYGEIQAFADPQRREEANLRITMARGSRATGRVTDSLGNPLEGVRVNAMIDPGDAAPISRGPLSGPDGTFDFSWIPIPIEGAKVLFLAMGRDSLAGFTKPVSMQRGAVVEGIEVSPLRPAEISFRLVDGEGEVYGGAQVGIDWEPVDVPPGVRRYLSSRAEAVAGPDGRVRLGGLRGGPHRLNVQFAGRVAFEREVNVPTGADTDLGDMMVPRKLAIAGRIRSTTERELERPRALLVGRHIELRQELTVAPDGSFRIEGLEDGDYTLRVFAMKHGEVALSVKAGREDLDIEIRALGQLFVKVEFPEGFDAESRVEVAAFKGMPTVYEPLWEELPIGKERALFTHLSAGRYRVRAIAADHIGIAETVVEPGAPTPGLVTIKLAPGARVEGVVLLPGGQPAAGAGVECEAEDGWGRRGASSDENGRYSFEPVFPGRVRMRSHPRGSPVAEVDLTLKTGETVTQDIQLKIGGKLRVTVLGPDGSPRAGARIGLSIQDGTPARFWIDGAASARTAADGQIQLVGITPGRYLMTVALDAEILETREVEFSEGEVTKQDVTIDR